MCLEATKKCELSQNGPNSFHGCVETCGKTKGYVCVETTKKCERSLKSNITAGAPLPQS